jgi:hypothetical protein
MRARGDAILPKQTADDLKDLGVAIVGRIAC